MKLADHLLIVIFAQTVENMQGKIGVTEVAIKRMIPNCSKKEKTAFATELKAMKELAYPGCRHVRTN